MLLLCWIADVNGSLSHQLIKHQLVLMRRPNNPSVSGPVQQCTRCAWGENGTLNFGLCHSYWYPFLSALCGIFHIFVWNREMSPYYFIIIIITKKKTWMSGIYKIYHRPPQKTASWNLRRKYFRYFRLSLHNHAVIMLQSLHPPTPQLPETHCGSQCSGPSVTILCL